MKKVVLISLVIIIAIGLGTGYLLLSGDKKSADQQVPRGSSAQAEQQVTQQTQTTPAPTPRSQPGTYIDFKDGVIASTKGTKILFFHAPWCPQCRALEADIKSNPLPEGVTIIKVDYDSSQVLRQKYGVTIQTTLVKVDDNGALLKKYVAYDAPTLESLKNNLL